MIKVLYIEPGIDEKTSCKIMEKSTSKMTTPVIFTVVTNAFAGLECTEHTIYDVIIISSVLEDFQANHMISVLRSVGADTPVILLIPTASDKPSFPIDNFATILHKPFSASELCRAIDKATQISSPTSTIVDFDLESLGKQEVGHNSIRNSSVLDEPRRIERTISSANRLKIATQCNIREVRSFAPPGSADFPQQRGSGRTLKRRDEKENEVHSFHQPAHATVATSEKRYPVSQLISAPQLSTSEQAIFSALHRMHNQKYVSYAQQIVNDAASLTLMRQPHLPHGQELRHSALSGFKHSVSQQSDFGSNELGASRGHFQRSGDSSFATHSFAALPCNPSEFSPLSIKGGGVAQQYVEEECTTGESWGVLAAAAVTQSLSIREPKSISSDTVPEYRSCYLEEM